MMDPLLRVLTELRELRMAELRTLPSASDWPTFKEGVGRLEGLDAAIRITLNLIDPRERPVFEE